MEKRIISEVCTINPPKIVPLSSGEAISFIPMDAVSTDGTVDLVRTISVGQIKNYSCFQNGDVLFAKITPCMENGKGAVVSNLQNGYGAGSTEFIVLRPNVDLLSAKWLFYYFSQKPLRMWLRNHMTGSAGQKRVPPKFLAQQTIPLPPLSEQQRIVARIEEMFSQLDSGVETLRKTKQQLAVYRQAVLKEAFSFDNQNNVELSQIADDIRIGPFGTMLHKEDYVQNGIPVINPQHIKHLAICESSKVTVSSKKADELQAYKLRENDVILGRRGEMGRAAAITKREAGWICGTGSILLRLKKEFDAVLYAQILSSPNVVHYLEENATGTTMKNLNEDIVKHVPVPSINRIQQTRILNRMEASLSDCDSIEQTVDAALQQAEALRQSILKQAFEGGL